MNALHPTFLLGLGAPGIQELIVIFLILAINVIWIWALIHCCRNPRLSDTNRVIGIVLIVVLNFLGAFIYLFLPRESNDPALSTDVVGASGNDQEISS